jgi:Putative zinc-finger
MKTLTCPAARRLLHAFHDEELSFSDQIAVGAHLDWCDGCAADFAALGRLRGALRALTPGRVALSREDDGSLQRSVVSRVKAERAMSWAAQAREMFDDMQLVYAGAGATMAAVFSIVFMIGLMRFAPSPGSNQNPVQVDEHVLMPRALNEPFATPGGGGDTAFMLAAVVTREGTIENLELLSPISGPIAAPGTDEARVVEHLLGAVSRARFEPARVAGLPVAVNMVWLVAHTTVRAARPALRLPVTRVAKKRSASLIRPPQLMFLS